MELDVVQVVPGLERDVIRTLGESHRFTVAKAAANVLSLDGAHTGEKVVEDVQQFFHDTFVDTTWPACPRHPNHPLWYRNGAWWCEQDKALVAHLGELVKHRERPGNDR